LLDSGFVVSIFVVRGIAYSTVVIAVVFFLASALTGGGRVDEEREFKGLAEVVQGEKGMNLLLFLPIFNTYRT